MTEIEVTTLRCKHQDCRHEWIPRFPKLPLVCPRCKRYDWNSPHVTKSNKGGRQNVVKARSPRKKREVDPIEHFKQTHNKIRKEVKGGTRTS